MSMIVHFMGHGMTACLMNGPPATWPAGHKWDSDWKFVNCTVCLAGRELIHTFTISPDGKAIYCLRCKRASFNQNDIEKHYCGFCHVFHDDIWPPARRAWLNSPAVEIKCRVCGCTEDNACAGGCHWVEPDLCSACVDKATKPDSGTEVDPQFVLSETDVAMLSNLEPTGCEIAGPAAFFILAAMQAGMRPFKPGTIPRQVCEEFARGLADYVSITPNLQRIAEAGFWKAYDLPPEKKIILPG